MLELESVSKCKLGKALGKVCHSFAEYGGLVVASERWPRDITQRMVLLL